MEWQVLLVNLAESRAPAWIVVGLAAVRAVRDITLGVCGHVTTMDPRLVDAWTRRLIAKRITKPTERQGVLFPVVERWVEKLFETDQVDSDDAPLALADGVNEVPGVDGGSWWRRLWRWCWWMR